MPRPNRRDSRGSRQPFSVNDIVRMEKLPLLSALNPGTIAATSLSNSTVLTDTNSGIVYMAVVSNGGSATNAQIIAGSGGNIVAGAVANVTVAAGATQTITSITSLVTATTYQLLALQVTGSGTQSLQVSRTFTTA